MRESNLFYIERNLATILPFKSKLSGKFQRFNAIEGSYQNAEFPKASTKMKNCKAFYEAHTSSCFKEIIQALPPPPHQTTLHQIKSCYVSGAKTF